MYWNKLSGEMKQNELQSYQEEMNQQEELV